MKQPQIIFRTFLVLLFIKLSVAVSAQLPANVFQHFDFAESDSFSLLYPLRFYEILCSGTGFHKFTSNYGLVRDEGTQVEIVFYTINDKKSIRNYLKEDSIITMAEGPGKITFFVSHDKRIFWQPGEFGGIGYTPFSFPPNENAGIHISKIWIDVNNDLYLGTFNNIFYYLNRGALLTDYDGQVDSAGIFHITKGEKVFTSILLAHGTEIHSFAHDPTDSNTLWIGTNHGLYEFNKVTKTSRHFYPGSQRIDKTLTITHMEVDSNKNIWFSSLEKAMGHYEYKTRTWSCYNYDNKKDSSKKYAVKTFCRKSNDEFFVAVMDSLPAIFNTTTFKYSFINDSIFYKTPDSTTDIKLDGFGNLFLIKGGGLFYTNYFKNSKPFAAIPVENSAYAPFISEIQVMGTPYTENGEPVIAKGLKRIRLDYNHNSLAIFFSMAEFVDRKNIQFSWMAEGYVDEWVAMPVTGDTRFPAYLERLSPGEYIFRVKAKVGNEDWRPQTVQLIIIITPPFWRTWWFWICVVAGLSVFTYFISAWRAGSVRKYEREKAMHEKQLLEMEARALRAQMNPHFIFNCLNSIKALIQSDEKEKSVEYLITFSKLIRTLFQNSDHRQVSLHDEIETCRLYTLLEEMRFDGKLTCNFEIDPELDLKSVMVPALIIQPFIENAVWHGIVPKKEGSITVRVRGKDEHIYCEVVDDGIGRETSLRNKPVASLLHESKGVHLSQARLNLEKILNETNTTIDIIDLVTDGKPSGTKVLFSFNLQ